MEGPEHSQPNGGLAKLFCITPIPLFLTTKLFVLSRQYWWKAGSRVVSLLGRQIYRAQNAPSSENRNRLDLSGPQLSFSRKNLRVVSLRHATNATIFSSSTCLDHVLDKPYGKANAESSSSSQTNANRSEGTVEANIRRTTAIQPSVHGTKE